MAKKITIYTSLKYWFIVLAAIIAVILIYYLILYFWILWREESLLKKYALDPQKKQFVEWMLKDKDDLSKNPERPQKIGILMDMGLQWYNLMEYDLAAKWWRKGLRIEPNNNIGWYNLGNAYRDAHKYRKAVKAYRKSMKVAQSGEIDGCLALGEMYRYTYTSKKDKEDDVYLECFKKHPNNRDLIARLAVYYRDIGDKKNAVLYFDKLWSIEPTAEVSEELRNLRLEEPGL